MDNPHKFEIRIIENNFIAEQSNYEGPRTETLEALKMRDAKSIFIIKDASDDTVLDDNGNEMLLLKILDRGFQPQESWVFRFKKIVHAKEKVLTDGEKVVTWIISGWGV